MIALSLLALTACSDPARISSGTWTLVEAWQDGSLLDEAVRPAGSLQVDARAGTVELLDGAGEPIASTTLIRRPTADWPSDCPTNVSSTRMEVADLDLDEVDLGGLRIVAPALMAQCPDGDALTLFADDSAAQGLSVCFESSACASYR
jgi:hypothetical protein